MVDGDKAEGTLDDLLPGMPVPSVPSSGDKWPKYCLAMPKIGGYMTSAVTSSEPKKSCRTFAAEALKAQWPAG